METNNSSIAGKIKQGFITGGKISPKDVNSIRDDQTFYHEIVTPSAKSIKVKVESLINKAQQDGSIVVNKPDDISNDKPFHAGILELPARLETFFASSDNDSTRTQEIAKMTNLSLLVDFLEKVNLSKVEDYKSVRLLKLLDLLSWKRQHSTSLLSLIEPSDFNKLLETFELLDKETYTKEEVIDMSFLERTALLLVGLSESRLIQIEMLLKKHKSHKNNALTLYDSRIQDNVEADDVASASELLRVWKLRIVGDTKTLWEKEELNAPPRRRFLAELLDPSKGTRLNQKEETFLGTSYPGLLKEANKYDPMEFEDAVNFLDEVYFKIPTGNN